MSHPAALKKVLESHSPIRSSRQTAHRIIARRPNHEAARTAEKGFVPHARAASLRCAATPSTGSSHQHSHHVESGPGSARRGARPGRVYQLLRLVRRRNERLGGGARAGAGRPCRAARQGDGGVRRHVLRVLFFSVVVEAVFVRISASLPSFTPSTRYAIDATHVRHRTGGGQPRRTPTARGRRSCS